MGAPPETIERAVRQLVGGRQPDDAGLAVHPDNVVAVKLFLAMSTQWRTVTLSTLSRAEIRRLGLDYGVVGATARLCGLEIDADQFARLRVMESAAIKAWNEEARR